MDTTSGLNLLIREASGLIATAARPSVFTGAGMSAESGIPTYRGEGGIWNEIDIDEVATPHAMHINMQGVWDFWQLQRQKVQSAQPNAGHLALATIEQKYLSGLPIITQNVDDLHERAKSRSVIHLHGQLMQNRCSHYCKGMPSVVIDSEIQYPLDGTVPKCPHCGEFLRADVIMFREYLHSEPLYLAEDIVNQTDLMLIIGTSALVAPASKIPLNAQDNGAILIEINPTVSPITPNVDVYLPFTASEALTQILKVLDDVL